MRTTEEIIKQTEHLYCFGEHDAALAARIEFARTLPPGEKCVEFGIGNGRTALVMCMANPALYMFTFDYGRRDIEDEDLMVRSIETAHSLGVYRYIPMIGEATKVFPTWKAEIGYLGIDTDGEGTGEQLRRWAPFVRRGGKIFVQNYALDKYPKIKLETDYYVHCNSRYTMGKFTAQVQEVDVL